MPGFDHDAADEPDSNAAKLGNKPDRGTTSEARRSPYWGQWACAIVGLLAALEYNYLTGYQALIPISILGAMLGRTIDTRSFRHWPAFVLAMIVALLTIGLSPKLKGRIAFNKGVDSLKSEDYEDAIGFFTKAIEHAPDNVQAYQNRGAARLQIGDTGAAIRDFNCVIERNPYHLLAYVNRGSAHIVFGRHKQAIEDCDEAIRLDPKCAIAYLNRASALRELGKISDAEVNLEKALQLDPQLESFVNEASK